VNRVALRAGGAARSLGSEGTDGTLGSSWSHWTRRSNEAYRSLRGGVYDDRAAHYNPNIGMLNPVSPLAASR